MKGLGGGVCECEEVDVGGRGRCECEEVGVGGEVDVGGGRELWV